jgi:hypothetical protein
MSKNIETQKKLISKKKFKSIFKMKKQTNSKKILKKLCIKNCPVSFFFYFILMSLVKLTRSSTKIKLLYVKKISHIDTVHFRIIIIIIIFLNSGSKLWIENVNE